MSNFYGFQPSGAVVIILLCVVLGGYKQRFITISGRLVPVPKVIPA